MKRMSLLLAALLASCATEIDQGERPQFWNGTNTLTILLFDGQTGAPVTTAEVKVQVGATALTAKVLDNAYTVAQIPFGSFPIFVKAPNYLDFVATGSFSSNSALNNANPQHQYLTYTALLFPTQTVEQDIVVKVFEGENGAALTTGQVVATIDTREGVASPIPGLTQQLQGSFGYLPRTITAPITAGVATLPKDQLVFGATYTLSVIGARDADGQYLSPVLEEESIQAGIGFQTAVVFVGPPAQRAIALSASNEDSEAMQATLVVRFPYPVELCSVASDHSWVNRTNDGPMDPRDTDNDEAVTFPADENSVTATLGEGGTVLTVGYVAETEDRGDSLSLDFYGIEVRVVGSRTCTDLFDVELRDSGDEVSNRLFVRKVEQN